MTPKPADASGVSEIYKLFHYAAVHRQPVAATYDGQPRLLCPHVGGRKLSRLHVFCYQFGGSSNSVEPLAVLAENCVRVIQRLSNHRGSGSILASC